jgi:hypothetical protein
LEVFVLEPLGTFLPQIYVALKAVGAVELVHRLEAAIPLALEGTAEFKRTPDQSWFKQFARVAEFPTLQSVDEGVFPIICSVGDLAAAFIRSNEGVLFEGGVG